MAPRIANDCFPDELIAVDYDAMGPALAVVPPGPDGGGGPHGAADLDAEAAALAAGLAGAAAAAEEVAGGGGGGTNGDGEGDGDDDAASSAIENDPLAMSGRTNRTVGDGSAGPQDLDSLSFGGLGTPTLSNAGSTVTNDHPTATTAAHLAAGQRGWDQFAAAQRRQNAQQQAARARQVQAGAAPAFGGGGGMAAALAARHLHRNHQQNHQQNQNQHQRGGHPQGPDHSPSSVSQSAVPSLGHHGRALRFPARAVPAVPRASSFGGFPSPAGRGGAARGASAGPGPHQQQQPQDGGAHPAASYRRFLSFMSDSAGPGPLGAVPVSEGSPTDSSAPSSPGDHDEDDDDEKMGSDGAVATPDGASDFGLTPPVSPSLLDQTSFPEEDDDADDITADKYLPDVSALDATADTTVDTTVDDDESMPSAVHLPQHGSRSLSGHVIHEDSPLHHGAGGAGAQLRPRPSPFARAMSALSNSSSMSRHSVHTTAGRASSHANGGALPTSVDLPSPGAGAPSPGAIPLSGAFDLSPGRPAYRHQISDVSVASNDGSVQLGVTPPPLSFGDGTQISDLTYYAEKGCIVDVLAALNTPGLKTLGSRMLADYAKMPHRRVAVASNAKILEFVQNTALEIGLNSNSDDQSKFASSTWLGREYAVETVRSLTAAEENDGYLMNSPGLLQMLALVARGGPFVQHVSTGGGSGFSGLFAHTVTTTVAVPPPVFPDNGVPGPRLMLDSTFGVASDKARLHACIAIMNLSCGKSNKVEITNVPEVLEGMRDVMLGRHFSTPPRTSSSSSSRKNGLADEARLKATTCVKNLSNADANDAALLGTPGLVETLGYVAEATCHPRTGATTCTTHACLALMNLSISKANKNRVFRTPGVMDALMAVITRTAPRPGSPPREEGKKDPNFEARVKACSALSNLAIGYDNKIPMFRYAGFVESILTVIRTDDAEARTKACSILWSFAAEMKNQVPVVRRGDILPALVAVAKEDTKTEARFKCVAALTLLAESPENAVPLLKAGSLEPLMDVLQEAGPDPTQWRGQTASWCVGFLMNMAQCDDVVPALLQEGIVDLLAPLLSLDHYQSLKAAMAVTFVCKYDTGDKTYNLLRQTENVIPKIVGLLHNTLSGRGGSGYKYGVFTLRSSVGCIASLAAGPDFMKERIATSPVFESLLRVVSDFCVDGGTDGAIVGGGKDDTTSVTLAVRAMSLLVEHLIPQPRCAAMPFGADMDERLVTALRSFEETANPDIDDETKAMANSARVRVEGGRALYGSGGSVTSDSDQEDLSDGGGGLGLSLMKRALFFPCGMDLHVPSDPTPPLAVKGADEAMDVTDDGASSAAGSDASSSAAVRTFLLTESRTGRRYVVPRDPSGGRQFNDNRVWCFRRGRYCSEGEEPDRSYAWSDELQALYASALKEVTP